MGALIRFPDYEMCFDRVSNYKFLNYFNSDKLFTLLYNL